MILILRDYLPKKLYISIIVAAILIIVTRWLILNWRKEKTVITHPIFWVVIVFGIVVNVTTVISSLRQSGQWFVIAGSFEKQPDAKKHAEKLSSLGFQCKVELSSDYKNFHPGWYIVVMGKFDKLSEVKILKKKLLEENIEAYAKYSGK